MSGTLKIGWSTKEFSTNEPTCMHGQFHVRICEGVLDPVTVTALVLDSGDEQMVWISCDVEHIADITSKLIREKIKKLAPEVDADRVVMNATHTHCTTDINLTGMARYEVDFPVDSSIKLMIPEKAQDEFAEAAAQAVAEAWKTRKEGGVAWGYGYAVVSYSRKTWYFDDLSQRPGQGGKIGMAVNGHACMYGNTNDPQFSHYEAGADHFINLMYTFDADGKLTGAIMNVPCPSQNSESISKLTGDYWNDVRIRLKEKYGDIHILPQCAPAGDLSPHILHYKAAQVRRFQLKYGTRPEAYRDEYMRKDIAERICAAFDEVLDWAKKDIRTSVKLQNSLEKIELERRQGTQAEYDNEKIAYDSMMKEDFQKTGTPMEKFHHDSILAARRNRSLNFMRRFELAQRGEPFVTTLHVIAIDDIAFVTSPFELYMDFMHRIQARSPFMQTFNVQLADNDWEPDCGYLATQRGVDGGGYSSSRYCNAVSPDGGQQLVEATLATLNKLKA